MKTEAVWFTNGSDANCERKEMSMMIPEFLVRMTGRMELSVTEVGITGKSKFSVLGGGEIRSSI